MERQKATSGRLLLITCWQLRLDLVTKGRRCGACLGRRRGPGSGDAEHYLEAGYEKGWEDVVDGLSFTE